VVHPGVEAPADEVSVTPESELRVIKAVEPCKGTEIVITFEDEDTGTRITFVQTGFGDGFAQMKPWLEAGWWAIRAEPRVPCDRNGRLSALLRGFKPGAEFRAAYLRDSEWLKGSDTL
jgi:hypothetical protein